MFRWFMAPVLILMATVTVLAQDTAPRFSQYSAAVVKGPAKAINFKKQPDARSFRTRLSAAVTGGTNFAGHYIVVGWGCGTGCISGAIIDSLTGTVYWPEEFHSMGTGYDETGYVDKPVEYRKNSRLFIINGVPGSADEDAHAPQGTHYFEWKNNRLRLVRSIVKPSEKQ